MYQTIVQAVLAHAKETPDKLAIGFKKIRVTYGDCLLYTSYCGSRTSRMNCIAV